MGPMQYLVSGLLTLLVYAMVLFAVYRVFQISNDVSEIKELLRAIKRNAEDTPAAPLLAEGARPADSAEALVRAVHASFDPLAEK